MSKNKSFDCVKMKWDIQKKIEKEYSGIPEKEACKIHLEKIKRDPILGPFYKKLYVVN
jgi:hypothetical protein